MRPRAGPPLPDNERYNGTQLQQLLQKAEKFVRDEGCDRVVCKWFCREKSSGYFNNIETSRGSIMEMYMKDNHGDPKNPINGRLLGLFFNPSVSRSTNGPPLESPYGDKRLKIMASKMVQRAPNLYFSDFYCVSDKNKPHYVQIVMTSPGSEADTFCREHLIRLSSTNNSFFYWTTKEVVEQVPESESAADAKSDRGSSGQISDNAMSDGDEPDGADDVDHDGDDDAKKKDEAVPATANDEGALITNEEVLLKPNNEVALMTDEDSVTDCEDISRSEAEHTPPRGDEDALATLDSNTHTPVEEPSKKNDEELAVQQVATVPLMQTYDKYFVKNEDNEAVVSKNDTKLSASENDDRTTKTSLEDKTGEDKDEPPMKKMRVEACEMSTTLNSSSSDLAPPASLTLMENPDTATASRTESPTLLESEDSAGSSTSEQARAPAALTPCAPPQTRIVKETTCYVACPYGSRPPYWLELFFTDEIDLKQEEPLTSVSSFGRRSGGSVGLKKNDDCGDCCLSRR